MSKTRSRADDEFALIQRGMELHDQIQSIRSEARTLLAQAARGGFQAPLFIRELAEAPTEAESDATLSVPMMKSPCAEPPGLGEHAMWVPVSSKSLQVGTLVLAVLAEGQREMSPAEILAKLAPHRDISPGTLANTGTTLAANKLIDRSGRGGGWTIRGGVEAAKLADGYVWGTPDQFGPQDIAWFRREAIKHLLRTFGGLQQMQIAQQLKKLDWVHGRKEKDTIKADLEALRSENAIHRVSHSRKWVLNEQEGSQ